MRLPGLSLAAVLLLSSVSFAQHSAPSAPPPPPPTPPASAPSPAPSFTPSAPPAPAPPPESHTSAPSSPAPSSAPAAAHIDIPSAGSTANPSPAASDVRTTDSNRIVPESKITGDEKIQSAPRIGEDSPDVPAKDKSTNDKAAKATPDLRRHICGDKPCEAPEPKPVETNDDLRSRPCLKEPCSCPSGEQFSHGKCVATVVQNVQCQPGEVANGTSCIAQSCPPNETWNGMRCVQSLDQCAAIDGQAANLIAQLRSLGTNTQQDCGEDPAAQGCDNARQHDTFLQQYRALWNSASPICRSRLPVPDSL
jgi:hypothetical protein